MKKIICLVLIVFSSLAFAETKKCPESFTVKIISEHNVINLIAKLDLVESNLNNCNYIGNDQYFNHVHGKIIVNSNRTRRNQGVLVLRFESDNLLTISDVYGLSLRIPSLYFMSARGVLSTNPTAIYDLKTNSLISKTTNHSLF